MDNDLDEKLEMVEMLLRDALERTLKAGIRLHRMGSYTGPVCRCLLGSLFPPEANGHHTWPVRATHQACDILDLHIRQVTAMESGWMWRFESYVSDDPHVKPFEALGAHLAEDYAENR